ncbi:energy transducer TonB [Paraurantiacibacter namhicola]|uniref:Gram-negative bacterial tonB protein n=1 Tax=Paraurantiacibacter namhicola TaxID=645517 RepID=A0A1C7D9X9_9SPHN|nr:energy transducer TonB [Paraurantiacibacter namhicola]ANU08172.1 Gram-negative bacterial tonB protein [Paraurantiacibacter namhicola]
MRKSWVAVLLLACSASTAPATAQSTEEAVEEAAVETVAVVVDIEGADGCARVIEDGEEAIVCDRAYLNRTGIRHADYPAEAWRNDEEGRVYFEVAHAIDGSIIDCRITESSGSEVLDAATCPIVLERGEVIQEGLNKAAGTVRGNHYWRKREPQFGIFSVAIAYTVGADGRLFDCEIVNMAGDVPRNMREDFGGNPCPNRSSEPPYRDENGVPINKRVQLSIEVTELPLPAE